MNQEERLSDARVWLKAFFEVLPDNSRNPLNFADSFLVAFKRRFLLASDGDENLKIPLHLFGTKGLDL